MHTEPSNSQFVGVHKLASSIAKGMKLIFTLLGGSVAEWLACWTQEQKGPGSNRSHDAVG